MFDMGVNPRLSIALSSKNNEVAGKHFSILIANNEGLLIGRLTGVDRALTSDDSIVADLTAWRQRAMTSFLTQFEARNDRTRAWLQRVVIPSPDRILFLICIPSGEPIGNIGIRNLGVNAGEIDNIIRGEKSGEPRIIYFGAIALLSWMFGYLNFEKATLHVFSNNIPALNLYESLGFTKSRSIPLSCRKLPQLIEYLLNSTEGDAVDFDCLEMELDRGSFLSFHPWVRHVYRDFW